MKALVTMTNGEEKWMSLPNPIWEGTKNIGTGITREAVFVGPKTKRVVVKTYSVWQKGNSGCCEGTSFHEADDQEIAVLADFDSDIAEQLEKHAIIIPEAL